jgi:hypothetical protein
MTKRIHVVKLPLLPLYRASGEKSNSLRAYGRTEEHAIRRLQELRRRNRVTPGDILDAVAGNALFNLFS